LGQAEQWFDVNKSEVTTWGKYDNAFLKKFFPMGKTSALRRRLSSFQQQAFLAKTLQLERSRRQEETIPSRMTE
jgi:hypothetical protein